VMACRASFLLVTLFAHASDPEDVGNKFLRNVDTPLLAACHRMIENCIFHSRRREESHLS
jgi:hypothetical protein